MSLTLVAVLVIIGLLFIILEILVIPGQGMFGILGLIILSIGIWQTYESIGTIEGHIVLASSFVLSVASLVISLRSNTWNRFMLKSEVTSKVNVIDETLFKVGDEGKAISRLAPAGKALFNNEFIEVHTHGDFVDPNTDLEIIGIDHNKIFVKQTQTQTHNGN